MTRVKLIILAVLCGMTLSNVKSALAQTDCAGGGLCVTLYENNGGSTTVYKDDDAGAGFLIVGAPGGPLSIGDYEVALLLIFTAGPAGMEIFIEGTVERADWTPGTATAKLILLVDGVSPFALAEATGTYQLDGFTTGASQIQHNGAYGLPQNFDVAWTSLNGAIIAEKAGWRNRIIVWADGKVVDI